MKYINRQAYIQVALMGTNFCTSCINAFKLLFRHAVRFAIMASLGGIINLIGYFFITASTTIVGYFILTAMNPDENIVITMLFIIIVSYIVGKLYMNVFGMAVDTSLQCLIAAEEMGVTEGIVPGPLADRVKELPADDKKEAYS